MEEERIEKAVALFKEGFNCSQSVVAAFADKYGFTQDQALRMSASFGEESVECVKHAELHVDFLCLPVWKRVPLKVQTVMVKPETMR